jgi:hypothetical protein
MPSLRENYDFYANLLEIMRKSPKIQTSDHKFDILLYFTPFSGPVQEQAQLIEHQSQKN